MKVGDKFYMRYGNVLTVVKSTGDKLSNGAELFVINCNICMEKDPELWYEGSIISNKYSLKRGQSPCGCSKPTYTKEQWRIRLDRVCMECGYEVIDYGGLENKNSKVTLHNPLTGNIWEISLHYFINQGTRDPWIYNMNRCDNFHISQFTKAGLNPEYVYKRSDKVSSNNKKCYWEVYCPVCEDYYTRYTSDLKSGKIPCDCSNRGYNVNAKAGYLYVVKFEIKDSTYIKFGITSRNPAMRWKKFCTNNNLKFKDLTLMFIIRHDNADEILRCETRLKRILRYERRAVGKETLKDGFSETMEYSVDTVDLIRRYMTFHLPCPAVGCGGKSVEDVLPLLQILPDNVIVYLDK